MKPVLDEDGEEKLHAIELEGYVFGALDERSSELGDEIKPVLLSLPNEPDLPPNVFPVFSTLDKMKKCFTEAGVAGTYRIKQIEDTQRFIDSVPHDLPVIVDPYRTPDGNTRFQLMQ